MKFTLSFNNRFFGLISDKSCLSTWFDIENEYYTILKGYLNPHGNTPYHQAPHKSLKEFNAEFRKVKKLLEEYLKTACKKRVTKKAAIQTAIESSVNLDDVAHSKRDLVLDHILSLWSELDGLPEEIDRALQENPGLAMFRNENETGRAVIEQWIENGQLNNYMLPTVTIALNFNYTSTFKKLYKHYNREIINIHGQLNSKPNNPIIFGYGDELDEGYKEIEKKNDNDFLDNIKSIRYHDTGNYRRFLGFLEMAPYQVFTMGHSCGNSDRTLLQTIFEHPNCISVKPYFHQWRDKESKKIEDDYTELIKNISRNFNDKKAMRDIVVNRENCSPLVPVARKKVTQP